MSYALTAAVLYIHSCWNDFVWLQILAPPGTTFTWCYDFVWLQILAPPGTTYTRYCVYLMIWFCVVANPGSCRYPHIPRYHFYLMIWFCVVANPGSSRYHLYQVLRIPDDMILCGCKSWLLQVPHIPGTTFTWWYDFVWLQILAPAGTTYTRYHFYLMIWFCVVANPGSAGGVSFWVLFVFLLRV